MPLLESLTMSEYWRVKALNIHQCKVLAKIARLEISFVGAALPGLHLVLFLDSIGYSLEEYKGLMDNLEYFMPQSKIAILIANDEYTHLPTLATPQNNREALGACLLNMGFIIIDIKNTVGAELSPLLCDLMALIPEGSFLFIYYAGYGCQVGNINCMLHIDCPEENAEVRHCITDNDLLTRTEMCKPEICVFIMDMINVYMDKYKDPLLYHSVIITEKYKVNKNLLIGYFKQSPQSVYATGQSTDSDNGDANQPSGGLTSQYVTALCARLEEETDINSVLDLVHSDMEDGKQKPFKLQYGTDKRFFFRVCDVNDPELLVALKDCANTRVGEEKCSIYMC